MVNLDKLDRLYGEAVIAPWRFVPWHIEEGCAAVRAPGGGVICTTSSDAGAECIAELHNAYPALAAEVRALRSEAANLRHGNVAYASDNANLQGRAMAAEAALAECRKDAEGDRSVVYEVWHDDFCQAGSDDEAEARHYAMLYGQDGPVTLYRIVSFKSAMGLPVEGGE